MPSRVHVASWPEVAERASAIRAQVFVVEQNVPAELEVDGRDPECVHALAEDEQGRTIGTARLLPDGHIGRMAVLAEARGRGAGSAMLRALLKAARERGLREVQLHAQSHARRFYEAHGFVAMRDEFLEAGIPHIAMRAALG